MMLRATLFPASQFRSLQQHERCQMTATNNGLPELDTDDPEGLVGQKVLMPPGIGHPQVVRLTGYEVTETGLVWTAVAALADGRL